LYVTSAVSELVAELQLTLGQGPGTEALVDDHPVLVPALGSDPSVRRWPAFAPAAVAAGVSAVFAFPLVMGAIAVGVLKGAPVPLERQDSTVDQGLSWDEGWSL
jgi:hypothetical protein